MSTFFPVESVLKNISVSFFSDGVWDSSKADGLPNAGFLLTDKATAAMTVVYCDIVFHPPMNTYVGVGLDEDFVLDAVHAHLAERLSVVMDASFIPTIKRSERYDEDYTPSGHAPTGGGELPRSTRLSGTWASIPGITTKTTIKLPL